MASKPSKKKIYALASDGLIFSQFSGSFLRIIQAFCYSRVGQKGCPFVAPSDPSGPVE